MLAASLAKLTYRRIPHVCLSSGTLRTLKVGDKVPVTYMKDEPAPVIKEDKEYPDWLSKIGLPLQSQLELMAKVNSLGVESLSINEAKRLKRLVILEEIKTANSAKVDTTD